MIVKVILRHQVNNIGKLLRHQFIVGLKTKTTNFYQTLNFFVFLKKMLLKIKKVENVWADLLILMFIKKQPRLLIVIILIEFIGFLITLITWAYRFIGL